MSNRQFRLGLDISAAAGNKTGVEYYILRLYSALREQLGDNLIAFARQPVAEVPAAIVLSSALPPVLWRQFVLPRHLSRYGVASLHSPVTAFPLLAPVPVVATIHDLCYRTHPEAALRPARALQRFWCEMALRRASAVLAVSATTGALLTQYYPSFSRKVRVVLSGALANPLPVPSPVAPPPLMGGIPQPFFLQVGRIDRRKSPLVTLEAFRTSGLTEFHLVFVGSPGNASGEVDDWLVRNPQTAARVHRCGYQPAETVAQLLQTAQALIYPSLDEGFGHPPLEALHFGTPSLVSDIPVLREVLADAAIFVPPSSSEALAAAMRMIATDATERARILLAGRARLQALDWRETAARLIALHRAIGDL